VGQSDHPEQSTLRYPSESPARVNRPLELVVVHSPDQDAQARQVALPMSPEQVTAVGREISAPALCIKDPRLSRIHFRIVWDQHGQVHRLSDVDSANGTFVNGARIATCPLEAGDVLRAGDTLFVIDAGDAMAKVRHEAELVAPALNTVLLLGESGTGKELLARFLHERSSRSGNFVPVNCAAIPRELVAAELFGHTRGAFSGAASARPGLFMAAEDGTLFLDEIADLPLDVQPALLRALQERRIRAVGAEREVDCSARIVAATHVDLAAECAAGRFRHDLYARLSRFVFVLPPLSGRRREILPLVRELSRQPLQITPTAAEALLLWDFPGNVRELQAIVETFQLLRPRDAELSLEFLEERWPKMAEFSRGRADAPQSAPAPSVSTPRQLMRLLNEYSWNITAVAQSLGCSRVQIYRWIKAYGLSRPGSNS
jgi:DNA-binding NtrC family response regulator